MIPFNTRILTEWGVALVFAVVWGLLPDFQAQANPPSTDLRLWLDASDGVVDSGGVATSWLDRASDLVPGDLPNDGDTTRGVPRLSTHSFANGTLPVVRFNGDDGFLLSNDDDLDLTGEISIYTVVVPDPGQSQIIIANYRDVCGFGLGISDNMAQGIKWFTAQPIDSLETGQVDLPTSDPVLLTATYDGGTKSVYKNRELLSSSSPGAMSFDCGDAVLSVGNLDTGRQYFTGAIAEILLYDSVSSSQRSAVESYLEGKYGAFAEFVSPSQLICRRTDTEEVRLSWANNSAYDSIRILRNGQQIIVLDPSSTSFTDTGAPAGTPSYEVLARLGIREDGPDCQVSDTPLSVFLSAATFFGSNAQGAVDTSKRWNTGPLDGAWDIGIGAGSIPANAAAAAYFNDPGSCLIDIPLVPGSNEFFFTVAGGGLEYNGMNLYFDGEEASDTSGISVFGRADDSNSVFANSASTMGWPITTIPGSGALVYSNGIVRVTLTDWFVRSASNGVDLVREQPALGGDCLVTGGDDGVLDLVGGFTLHVAESGQLDELRLSAATFFGANASGSVDPGWRWNAGPIDDAWDLSIGVGDVPANSMSASFLNDPGDCRIDFPLALGDNTFFFTVAGGTLEYSGMNLFFDGFELTDTPGISVFGRNDDPASFAANSAPSMGWPASTVSGSGALFYTNGMVTVSLTEWSFSSAGNGVDLVQPQATTAPPCVSERGADGVPDVVGQFTLTVMEGTIGVFTPRPFEDVTVQMGLPNGMNNGSGSWGDFNNDGFPDLVVPGGIYRNNAGQSFTQIGTFEGNAPALGDYDNDGFLDFAAPGAVGLYHNEGGTSFTPVNELLPVTPPGNVPAVAWGDFDLDGWIDLFAAGHENPAYNPDFVLENIRSGSQNRFEVGYVESGRIRPGRAVSVADFDEDGDVDVFVPNYRLERNYLLRNDGSGGFTDVAQTTHESVGGVGADVAAGHGSGCTWGDLNNDGHLDLVVSSLAHPWGFPIHDKTKVYRNLGPGSDYTFEDRGESHQIEFCETHAGVSLGDFDNDGNLDLWITTFGYGENPVSSAYRGTGNFVFEKVSPGLGLTHSGNSNLQTAWADFDNDGNLDLLTNGRLYRNPGQNDSNHWLKVQLLGELGYNTAEIGAQVRIRIGGRTLTRHVSSTDGSQGSGNDLALHFGLGPHSDPVELEVRWTDGTVTSHTVGVDQVVQVSREGTTGGGVLFLRGDVNLDGNHDFTDAIALLEFLFLGIGVITCADAADANDDGMNDFTDAIRSLTVLFLGGVVIPEPGARDCGSDPTEDALGCESFEPCE